MTPTITRAISTWTRNAMVMGSLLGRRPVNVPVRIGELVDGSLDVLGGGQGAAKLLDETHRLGIDLHLCHPAFLPVFVIDGGHDLRDDPGAEDVADERGIDIEQSRRRRDPREAAPGLGERSGLLPAFAERRPIALGEEHRADGIVDEPHSASSGTLRPSTSALAISPMDRNASSRCSTTSHSSGWLVSGQAQINPLASRLRR